MGYYSVYPLGVKIRRLMGGPMTRTTAAVALGLTIAVTAAVNAQHAGHGAAHGRRASAKAEKVAPAQPARRDSLSPASKDRQASNPTPARGSAHGVAAERAQETPAPTGVAHQMWMRSL